MLPPLPAHHTRAVIIASGDEIITGQLLDTNSRWIAEQLMGSGILPVEHVTIPDELPALVGALRRACEVAPLVIISGGLGPTEGDLTRQALSELTADPLVLDADAESTIRSMLAKRDREMTDRQRRQAQRPSRANYLPNPVGTAPGLHLTHGADVFALPGPPGELRPMWLTSVVPLLRPDPSRIVITRLLHIVGIPEADCVTRLGDLTRRDRPATLPLVGITASGGILTLRIRYAGKATRTEAAALVDQAESQARAELGDHIVAAGEGGGPERLCAAIIDALTSTRTTLGTVESCTGGMLGQMLTAIPGSSSVYLGGHITYANALKESLGVSAGALQQHGAVSPQVALEMARAGLERTHADYCLAITGIAGPDGGTPAKPVGTVHIALASRASGPPAIHSRHFLFTGDREDIRRRACVGALAMLHFHLRGRPAGAPRLLWELGTPKP